jgi:hypothetical protein
MATESDNVNSGALGTLVAVGTIAFFGIALVVTALVRAEIAEEVEKKEVSADRPYRDLVAEQSAKLNAPASYTDRARGLVSLPIDRAMELTVASLAKDPNSATPPAPAGGAGGTAATEAGGSAGMGGSSGASSEAGGTAGAGEPEKKGGEEPKPAGDLENEGEKKDGEKEKKKEAPKPVPAASKPGAPGAPAAPTPVAPTPAPAAPSPAPNGQ